jgi:type VI secretion system Hcp family effector
LGAPYFQRQSKKLERAAPSNPQHFKQTRNITSKSINRSQGIQEHYYTTKLEDAIIVNIKDYMHNCQDPANSPIKKKKQSQEKSGGVWKRNHIQKSRKNSLQTTIPYADGLLYTRCTT